MVALPSLALTTSPLSTICLSRAEAFWTETSTALPTAVAVMPSESASTSSIWALMPSFSFWTLVGLRSPLDLRTDLSALSTRKLNCSSVSVSNAIALICSVIVIFVMCNHLLPFFLHFKYTLFFKFCQEFFLNFSNWPILCFRFSIGAMGVFAYLKVKRSLNYPSAKGWGLRGFPSPFYIFSLSWI